jgi:hypothetical protein
VVDPLCVGVRAGNPLRHAIAARPPFGDAFGCLYTYMASLLVAGRWDDSVLENGGATAGPPATGFDVCIHTCDRAVWRGAGTIRCSNRRRHRGASLSCDRTGAHFELQGVGHGELSEWGQPFSTRAALRCARCRLSETRSARAPLRGRVSETRSREPLRGVALVRRDLKRRHHDPFQACARWVGGADSFGVLALRAIAACGWRTTPAIRATRRRRRRAQRAVRPRPWRGLPTPRSADRQL